MNTKPFAGLAANKFGKTYLLIFEVKTSSEHFKRTHVGWLFVLVVFSCLFFPGVSVGPQRPSSRSDPGIGPLLYYFKLCIKQTKMNIHRT